MILQNKIIFLSLMTCCLLGLSCKKTEILPEETQNGSNTFACKVNGEIWKYDVIPFSISKLGRPESVWEYNHNQEQAIF